MQGEVVVRQRTSALLTANAVRSDRALLKRQIKARTTDPVRVLLDLPRCCENVHVHEFLMWTPRVGKHRANRLMGQARVMADVELRRLGSHTRLRLAEQLRAAIARQS